MKKNSILKLIVALLFTVLLAACGTAEVTNTELFVKEEEKKASMLEEAEFLYEPVVDYPGILVDINGYESNDEKKAILLGKTLPALFEVRKLESGEIIHKGSVRKINELEDGTLVGAADFSQIGSPGEYYIQTEILGRSKTFRIADSLFEKEAEDALNKLYSIHCDNCHSGMVPLESDKNNYIDVSGGWHTSAEGEKDVVEGCLSVVDICTAYDFYTKLFSDDKFGDNKGNNIPDIIDEAIYETKWLLKMQNPETGGVYTSVSLQEVNSSDSKRLYVGGETTRATAYFCACMARVSTTIKKFDPVLSQAAYQAAVLSWNCLEANRDIVSAEQRYRAAVELYRISGSEVYATEVINYLSENAGKEYESRLALDAAITYLATPRATNVEYCTNLMAAIMDRTELKVDASEANFYGIESTEETVGELLRNTYELAIVDYIISSIAYNQIEKNYIHYLCGRNEFSYDFTEDILTPNALVDYYIITKKLSGN